MTILDFCRVRNIQTQRVLKYIQRNPAMFEGHISKNGQQTEVDEYGLKVLEAKYPIPPEIIPSPDAELRRQLESAKEYIITLQNEAISREKLLAKAELDKILLEERSHQLLEMKTSRDDLQDKNAELLEQIGNLKAKLEMAEKETEQARQEVENLKHRSFWQRLFNS